MTKFTEIFKDDNDINEKSILGFCSFGVMLIVVLIDIISGILGYDIRVTEFIYNSFVTVTLGSFGIGAMEKGAGYYRDYKIAEKRAKEEDLV